MIVKLSKYFILFMFLIMLFTILYGGIYYRWGDNSVLQNAFLSSGAKFVNSEVYVWSNMDEHNQDMEKLLKLADQLEMDLSVVKNNTYTKQYVKEHSFDKLEIKGICADGKRVDIAAQQCKDNSQKSNISVNVINRMGALDINDTVNAIKERFKSLKLKPKINTCIIGCFDGKLDYEEMNRISENILKCAKAKKIESLYDNNLISISAYSPCIDNNIEVKGKRININIALRYNAYEDKTYIWLATPVIAIEY
ncbi:YwmB family TATA-box binding protein [Acetivibrio clariflavus]|uniref:TATA-box binding n=1 Tax=Acetivibrio clariflavus (strain DSM 19732 / NBRC 101661 / EBR45) TaxID=720554 RepID=G8M1W4_ACECE|nr:YwmB family TATA-box binding protein [Acetivibrio clariflavus]AEV67047.1 Protein of unknown function (DUF1779) [Acetivibrio clariflavus DSM 19732]